MIQFPGRKRVVVGSAERAQPSLAANQPEARRLSDEEVVTLSCWKVPFDKLPVDEHDCLVLEPDEEREWARFFYFFGLRLPARADADTAWGIFRELTLTYGKVARLASAGRADDVARVCPELTPDQRGYGIAAGRQERALAQRLAKNIFFGRQRSAFWVQ